MSLIGWVLRLFVDLPPRASSAELEAAEGSLSPKIAAIEVAEAEKRRIAEEKRRIAEEKRRIEAEKRRIEEEKRRREEEQRRREMEERRRKEGAENPHSGDGDVCFSRGGIASDGGSRWSITAMPGRVFDDDAESAAVSAQIAAKAAGKKTFSEELLSLVRVKCDGNAPMAYKRAGISRQSYSRIVSSQYARVDKTTAMRLCVGLQLTVGEAESLLRSAGYAFSDSVAEDVVFRHCLEKRILNVFDINTLLERCGQKAFEITF